MTHLLEHGDSPDTAVFNLFNITPHPSLNWDMGLVDDGSMDTVVACSYCGKEYRFTYDDEGYYSDFVEWALDDAASDHFDEIDPAGTEGRS